jgi:photosystem II stability/assembly factor-like uncharacterized protein
MAYYVTPNVVNNGIYSGNCFAFGASGGFIVQQGFSEIQMRIPDLLNKYDVTNAIQVKFSTRTLNNKIGILKDPSNIRVVEAWFDPVNDKLGYDSLKICACEFVNGVNIDSVVSVGRLQQLYSDFNTVVSNYFGDPGGFSSLFAGASEFDVNDGIFDASALIQILNSSTFNMEGSFVSDLSGDVHIYDINDTLQHAIDANIFRNRNPATYNYGIIDGFVAGDLIFIPEGFTISLSLDIQAETLLPINNVGPSFLNPIRDKLNWTRGYVKRSTTWSTTNITQSTTLPILLVLSDVDLQNYTNYGLYWSIASNVIGDSEQRSDKWLAISLSASGKYQTAITESGDIFISCDYGSTRNIVFNIGLAECNSISISFTGKYQTASNGRVIYVSSDYGQTWNQTFSSGTSNIFVSISLTGQYQTLVSCGDNVYFSKDFGNTWRPMDTNTELYFSIEGFPTAGIALSYTGLYQTIVTENIYISNDYGETWRNIGADNDFGDRNWQAVAISSDGLYQSAIENGGDIYTSSDYGNTWTFVSDPNLNDLTWESIALSATGQYQTALQQNGGIYISSDYGYSWIKVPDIDSKKWKMVSISSDALYQCVIEYSGYIYMSQILMSTNNGEPCKCDDDMDECY